MAISPGTPASTWRGTGASIIKSLYASTCATTMSSAARRVVAERARPRGQEGPAVQQALSARLGRAGPSIDRAPRSQMGQRQAVRPAKSARRMLLVTRITRIVGPVRLGPVARHTGGTRIPSRPTSWGGSSNAVLRTRQPVKAVADSSQSVMRCRTFTARRGIPSGGKRVVAQRVFDSDDTLRNSRGCICRPAAKRL
jgi:hypothetical protein